MANAVWFAVKESDRALKSEATFTRVTGIEKEDVTDSLCERLVCMAEDDDVGTFACEMLLQRSARVVGVNNVMDEEFPGGERHNFHFAEL